MIILQQLKFKFIFSCKIYYGFLQILVSLKIMS